MRIRGDTPNPAEVPKVGQVFKVIRVEQPWIWWTIELEEVE